MTDNIIKLLNLEDSDLIVEGPVISNGKKVLTLTKERVPAFCPICGTKMYSKGIYTRTVNHPVLQDGTQLILKLNQRRWCCINPVCKHSCNDTFSFVDSRRRNTNCTDISPSEKLKTCSLILIQI